MFEDVPALSILPFFSVSCPLTYLPKKQKTFFTKEYLLPDTSAQLGQPSFADIYAAWSEEKLAFHIEVGASFESSTADYRKGDTVELFIDTRDLKTRRFMTQFCHHFVFFPEKVDGVHGKEVTKFRTDDIHPLASPEDVHVSAHISKAEYILDIEIPKQALNGFEPAEVKSLGFTYRINRSDDDPQDFAFSSLEYNPEQCPHLWGSMKLIRS